VGPSATPAAPHDANDEASHSGLFERLPGPVLERVLSCLEVDDVGRLLLTSRAMTERCVLSSGERWSERRAKLTLRRREGSTVSSRRKSPSPRPPSTSHSAATTSSCEPRNPLGPSGCVPSRPAPRDDSLVARRGLIAARCRLALVARLRSPPRALRPRRNQGYRDQGGADDFHPQPLPHCREPRRPRRRCDRLPAPPRSPLRGRPRGPRRAIVISFGRLQFLGHLVPTPARRRCGRSARGRRRRSCACVRPGDGASPALP